MEIILKEDIIGLGYKNDIVNVKSGYGRNYLIPQGKGVIASPMAKKILAENLKQQAHKLAAIKAAAEEKAAALNGVTLEIAAKVSATGQLYGSVGANQVAEELKKLGKEVDRKIITMKDAKLRKRLLSRLLLTPRRLLLRPLLLRRPLKRLPRLKRLLPIQKNNTL